MKEGEFYKKRLENGPIVLFEKRNLPVVSVMAAVPFGSAHEAINEKGIAHFIEHMSFKGTEKRNMREIKEDIEKVGGILNAFTDREITAFWAKLPSKHFDTGIDVISDIMINPIFNQKELEKERKVIFEEMKMYHDDPHRFSMEKAEELLYKKPFGMPIIGTKDSLEKIDQNIMLKTHEVYSPKNIVVSIVGNADFNDVMQKVKEKFYSNRPFKPIKSLRAGINYGSHIEKRKNIHQASIAIGIHAPSTSEKMKYAAEAFNTILGVGMSSRLFDEIREKRGLAYRAQSFYCHEKSYGNIIACIGTMKDKIKKVKQLALNEMKKLQQLTSRELSNVKEQMIGLNNVSNEESDEVARKLIWEEMAGNAEDFYEYDKFVNAIKLEDVRKIAKIKNFSFVAVVPD